MQSWLDLTFLTVAGGSRSLAPYMPDGLELDTHEGVAYLGVIPFNMTEFVLMELGANISTPGQPRTYVTHGGKAGVLFLTLEAQSRITCTAPRLRLAVPLQPRLRAGQGRHAPMVRKRSGGTPSPAPAGRPDLNAKQKRARWSISSSSAIRCTTQGRLMILTAARPVGLA